MILTVPNGTKPRNGLQVLVLLLLHHCLDNTEALLVRLALFVPNGRLETGSPRTYCNHQRKLGSNTSVLRTNRK